MTAIQALGSLKETIYIYSINDQEKLITNLIYIPPTPHINHHLKCADIQHELLDSKTKISTLIAQ